jgi:hypothetical protein
MIEGDVFIKDDNNMPDRLRSRNRIYSWLAVRHVAGTGSQKEQKDQGARQQIFRHRAPPQTELVSSSTRELCKLRAWPKNCFCGDKKNFS